MSEYKDLVDEGHRDHMTTLGYWIGNTESDMPREKLCVSLLSSSMSTQYSIEDQCFADEYDSVDDFTDKYFNPVAPVTLAQQWSPIPSAEKWLGTPTWKEVEDSHGWRSAACYWSKTDDSFFDDLVSLNEDVAHFRFLLTLAVTRAMNEGGGILIVCTPGWSYEYAQENPLSVYGYSALSAGRLYPERLPSGKVSTAPKL